jgi:hypothetical protein
MKILSTALRKSVDAFGLLAFLLSIAVIIFSSLMFYAERGTCDDDGVCIRGDGKVSPFTSIPATFYWCVVTMTTVGYGDMVPVESAGMVVAVITMICGIMVLALPITVLGQNFSDAYMQAQMEKASTVSAAGSLSNTDTRLSAHITALRSQREELSQTLKQVHHLLQSRPGAEGHEFNSLWVSVDTILIMGLFRIENYLTYLQSKKMLDDDLVVAEPVHFDNQETKKLDSKNTQDQKDPGILKRDETKVLAESPDTDENSPLLISNSDNALLPKKRKSQAILPGSSASDTDVKVNDTT